MTDTLDWKAEVTVDPGSNRIILRSGSDRAFGDISFTPRGVEGFASGLELMSDLCDERKACWFMMLIFGSIIRMDSSQGRQVATELRQAAVMARPTGGMAS